MLVCTTQRSRRGCILGSTAHDLGVRLHDLARSLRLIRQCPGATGAVPLAGVGLLTLVDEWPGGCHARDLAHQAALDPSTVSRAVAGLVAQGLLERRADPADRRATVLAVTAAGPAALTDVRDRHARVLDRAPTGWTAAEVAALCAALDRFTHDVTRALGHHDTLEAAR